jgi:hypothetical protein
MHSSLMMEAVRTSETSVDNHFTRQYNPEDSSEHQSLLERPALAVAAERQRRLLLPCLGTFCMLQCLWYRLPCCDLHGSRVQSPELPKAT